MKSPSHPGAVIRTAIIEPLGLTVTDAAGVLGVSRPALSNVLNQRAALTPEMALRIEKAFGPTMDHLMRIQLAFELALMRGRERSIKVRRFRKRSGSGGPGL